MSKNAQVCTKTAEKKHCIMLGARGNFRTLVFLTKSAIDNSFILAFLQKTAFYAA